MCYVYCNNIYMGGCYNLNKPECMSNLMFPPTTSVTGINETQTYEIKPCDVCNECYVKGNKFWCNHCVEAYEIISSVCENNKVIIKSQGERSIGILMGILMKQLRGKISGEVCNKLLRLELGFD